MPVNSLPYRPNLDHLKNQAKDLLKGVSDNSAESLERVRRRHPKFADASGYDLANRKFGLREAQLVIAREYGYDTWTKLISFVDANNAVLTGNHVVLLNLLNEDPSLASARQGENNQGMQSTLLHLVTGMAEVEWTNNAAGIAQSLIDAGAEVNAPDRESGGQTPLIHAVSINNVPVAEVLLKAGADTEAVAGSDATLDTALGNALFYGTDPRLKKYDENCPELLVRYGAKVYLPFAAGLGRLDLVKEFFDESGTVKPNAGRTGDRQLAPQQALMFACQYGHTEVVEFILINGGDINASTDLMWRSGLTPLAWAKENGHVSVIELLQSNGAKE